MKDTSPKAVAKRGWKTKYDRFISRWKDGEESGMKGKTGISGHIRKYMFDKYDSKCCLCGWCMINPVTNKSPLEIDHIDGDHRNNIEENLRLLCPNCHSLTPTYKSLNIGNGREERYTSVV